MKCILGCKVFSGNETYHHKDCPHYPESFSKRFDLLQAENKWLKENVIAAIELLEIGIRNAQTGIPLWESVGDVQEVLGQALKFIPKVGE